METVEQVLEHCTVLGTIVKLPQAQLDRRLYLNVAKRLEMIGGKWKGGKVGGFVFQTDPSPLLGKIQNGEKCNLKKEYQFFPTPDRIADDLVSLAAVRPQHDVLEPSAGQGAIVKAIDRKYASKKVDCYELMEVNRTILCEVPNVRLMGFDFLQEDNNVRYDRSVANPPFSGNQDIDHIREMFRRLKPEGRLVSIASKHWQISQNRKETDFRHWLHKLKASFFDLKAGEFKESGTMVGSAIVIIDKP